MLAGINQFRLMRNTGSGFSLTNAGMPGLHQGPSVAWGDFDNNGRSDILLGGFNGSSNICQIWQNTGKRFIEAPADVTSRVSACSLPWGDYDNDGWLDVLVTGFSGGTNRLSQIWRNTGDGFTNINAGLTAFSVSSAAWGDYDNDGRLDILLCGNTGFGSFETHVWRNTINGFTNINAGLPGANGNGAAWADYDNDGRLDVFMVGLAGTNYIAELWRNTSNGFTNVNVGIAGLINGITSWGDYDNDGRLDLLIFGHTNAYLWRNNTPVTNTPPSAPSGLNVTMVGDIATLDWNAASDAQTPTSGLTYNVRVGTTPGGCDLVGPMSASNGTRRLPQMGNAQMATFKTRAHSSRYVFVLERAGHRYCVRGRALCA